MKTSEQIGELAAALAKAQGELEGAHKDSANPFFKSKYADLASVWDACRGPLSENGLAIVQLPRADGNAVTMETRLMHSSGQWIEGELTAVAKDEGPQSIGSAVTYLRRYMLQAVTGVAPEDDDGNAATSEGAPPQKNTRPPKSPAKQVAEQHGMKTADELQPSLNYKRAMDKITAAVRERDVNAIAGVMNLAEQNKDKLIKSEYDGIVNECTMALKKIKAAEKEPVEAAA
jgi:hypothetical protein